MSDFIIVSIKNGLDNIKQCNLQYIKKGQYFIYQSKGSIGTEYKLCKKIDSFNAIVFDDYIQSAYIKNFDFDIAAWQVYSPTKVTVNKTPLINCTNCITFKNCIVDLDNNEIYNNTKKLPTEIITFIVE